MLVDFAAGVSPAVRGACSALWAELEAAEWQSAEEVAAMFPLSPWEEGKLIVALDERACAVIAFNYRSGIALIEFAGSRGPRNEPSPPKHRKAFR